LKAQKEEVYHGKVKLKRIESGVWAGALQEGGEKTSVRVVLNKTEEAFSKTVEADGKKVMNISFHTKGIQNIHGMIIAAYVNGCDCKKEIGDFSSAVGHIKRIEGKKLPSQLPPIYADFGEFARPLR